MSLYSFCKYFEKGNNKVSNIIKYKINKIVVRLTSPQSICFILFELPERDLLLPRFMLR